MAPGTGRNGTERFGDWLVGESGKTQGCQYFLKKDNVCGKVVSMRIGMGYDVHRLVEGRDLIIGGVKIPYEKGLLGHSDACHDTDIPISVAAHMHDLFLQLLGHIAYLICRIPLYPYYSVYAKY